MSVVSGKPEAQGIADNTRGRLIDRARGGNTGGGCITHRVSVAMVT